MRTDCIFGLGSNFEWATDFFLNILLFAVLSPSDSFVSFMEKLKILLITRDHLIIFIWQTLPSQETSPRRE